MLRAPRQRDRAKRAKRDKRAKRARFGPIMKQVCRKLSTVRRFPESIGCVGAGGVARSGERRRRECLRTTDRHGLPMRGNSHPMICRYGSPLDGIRAIAFGAKGVG